MNASPQSFGEAWEQFKFEFCFITFLGLLVVMLPVLTSLLKETPQTYARSPAAQTEQSEQEQQTQGAVTEIQESPQQQAPASQQPVPTRPAGSSVWPIRGRVTAEFGTPHRPWQDRHTGIDISSGSRRGTMPVVAFKDGAVAKTVLSGGGLGRYVVVNHGEGVKSLYAHLDRLTVRENQEVQMGDTVGYEGNTGATTGTHLHFEVHVNGNPTNPRNFINGNP